MKLVDYCLPARLPACLQLGCATDTLPCLLPGGNGPRLLFLGLLHSI